MCTSTNFIVLPDARSRKRNTEQQNWEWEQSSSCTHPRCLWFCSLGKDWSHDILKADKWRLSLISKNKARNIIVAAEIFELHTMPVCLGETAFNPAITTPVLQHLLCKKFIQSCIYCRCYLESSPLWLPLFVWLMYVLTSIYFILG